MDVDRHLRLLAEQTREHAMLLLDLKGRILWHNPAALAILGLAQEETKGRTLAQLFPAEDRKRGLPQTEIDTAIAHGRAENDRWMERADGSRFWATGVTTVLRDETGAPIALGKILRDRTDLREHIDTLRNQALAAADNGRRQDEFLSTLSHELRNPLAPLVNAVEIIRRLRPGDEALRQPLGIIDRQIASLSRLVDDLLDATRVNADKVDLRVERISLQEVLRRAAEVVQPAVAAKSHELSVIAPAGGIIIDGDPQRLEQVFTNLLGNAAKYTAPHGRIRVRCTSEGEEAVVHVEDNGAGIPGDMLNRIFDMFTQVESSKSDSQGGLGIGLALVKKLVALHGGTVQVRSEGPGKGSLFSVRLPCVVPNASPIANQAPISR